jgi:cell division protein FtsB
LEFVFENDKDQNDVLNVLPQAPTGLVTPDSFESAKPIAPKSKPRRATRRSVATNVSDIEFAEPRRRNNKRANGPKVNYVKSVKKKRAHKRKFEWSWMKFGWMICGALMLRLVLMDGGLIDYNSMENTLENKEYDLTLLRQDNVELIKEIHKIKTSPSYQRKLAREHLGVIAKDEYLVLFAKESTTDSI